MKRYLSIIALLVIVISIFANPNPPSVTNLQITQRTDGSGLVDIFYDLFDVNNDPSQISVLFSTDAGQSYSPLSTNMNGISEITYPAELQNISSGMPKLLATPCKGTSTAFVS